MDSTDILGIRNRTENWKTANTFARLITHNRQHQLATWIIGNATKQTQSFRQSEVCIELYWKGFRDYCKSIRKTKTDTGFIEKTAARYNRLFPHLLEQIENYNNQVKPDEPVLNLKKDHNYVCDETPESSKRLYDNLLNTEIDVVLNAPGFLLIGEVKHEQAFGADSRHVLPHQLVRQYVMASIVVDMIEEEQSQDTRIEVIPFIIGDNLDKYAQVKLLKFLHHLNDDNVISWDKLSKLIKDYCNGS